jgi:hypothetical protein
MHKFVIAIGLAFAAAYGAAPAAAQVIYFGYGPPPPPPYYGGYYHRPPRYYRHHRRYVRRYCGYSRYSGRYTCDLNEIAGCPIGWTVQDGVCKPYRGY